MNRLPQIIHDNDQDHAEWRDWFREHEYPDLMQLFDAIIAMPEKMPEPPFGHLIMRLAQLKFCELWAEVLAENGR